MRKLSVFLAALLCVFFATAAFAQYDNGSIVGTAHDQSGAALPGATVKITNLATGAVSTATTQATGDYEVPNLKVGDYNVVISHPGFADASATNIAVTVAGRARIDLTLNVGKTETTVEVTGVQLQLETETSERGQIITNYESEAFPLVSRNYSDLLARFRGRGRRRLRSLRARRIRWCGRVRST